MKEAKRYMRIVLLVFLKKYCFGKMGHFAGLILQSKGMLAIFEKKGKKGQNIWKFGQKCTKFENILKKGSPMHATITHIKELEYALILGSKMVGFHNSAPVRRIFCNFSTIKESKRCMKVTLIGFPEKVLFGANWHFWA